MDSSQKVLVTTPPPTPNGDAHMGHVSGPYSGADFLVRFLRMNNIEAYHLTGADDFQSYVQVKAERLGSTPENLADHYTSRIQRTLMEAEIKPDLFVKPRRDISYISFINKFFNQLYEDGKLIAKESPSLYCEHCARDLFEAHVSGQCPHCGSGSDGDTCEQCGCPNDCIDLINPVCKSCGRTPNTHLITRLYFPLQNYEQQLRQYYQSVSMESHLRVLCERMLTAGLPDFPVSQVTDWGIPLSVPGFEGQCLAAWAGMAPGQYLAAAGQFYNGDWQTFWKNDDARIVQFMGFDNGYFHAILFPALLLAYDPEVHLPEVFITNEFYLLNGEKFSTSRGHAIWADELLKQYPADLVRFYVCYTRPETEQTNFTFAEFHETIHRELLQGWQVWLHQLGAKLSTEYGEAAPVAKKFTTAQQCIYWELKDFIRSAARAYDVQSFSPQRVTRILCELVRMIRRFSKEQDYLSGVGTLQEMRDTGVALELLAARILAQIAAPIMPCFSSRLWQNLGYETELLWEENADFIPYGQKIHGLEVPFFRA